MTRSMGRPPRPLIDQARLRELHTLGVPDTVIAAEFGVHRSSVVHARQRLGLPAVFAVGEKRADRARRDAKMPGRGPEGHQDVGPA